MTPRRRLVAAVCVTAGVLCGGAEASAATTTFTTPGQHAYTVPAGVTRVDVVAVGGEGAASGGSEGRRGGLGARVAGTLDVKPGDTLYAVVGTSALGTAPGANGGGPAGGTAAQCPTAPGAGGGASDVRKVPLGQPGSPGSRVLVAGGGGGATSFGVDGGTSADYFQLAGGNRGRGGGSQARGGEGGFNGDPGTGGGGGAGEDGTTTTGGRGAAGVAGEQSGCGGGGGGGYGGGGGGAAGTAGSPGGGGGGGGSLVPEGRWPGIAGPGEPTSVTFITPGTPAPSGRLGITTIQTFKQDDQGGGPVNFTNCPFTCAWRDFHGVDGGRAPGITAFETLASMQGWGSSALIDPYFSQSYVGFQPPAAGHPAEVGEPFLMGDFAHINTPIRGVSPTAFAFQTLVRAQAPAGDPVEFRLQGPGSIALNFLETDNSPPCDPAIQVSPAPCDDRWTFDDASRTTVANGVTWHFELLGWRTPTGTFEKRFVTQERYINHRGVYGRITVDTNATTSALSVGGATPAAPRLRLTTTPVPQTGGTVTFTDGGAPIPGCTGVPVGDTDGLTACTPARLSPGTHRLAASFSGGVGYGPSAAPPQTHVVPGVAGPPGAGTPPPGVTPPSRAKLILRRISLRRALRRGFVVSVVGAKPKARIRLTARLRRSKVASGQSRARANGKASIRLRFTAKARRRLRGAKRVRLTVRGRGLPALTVRLR